MKKGLIFTWLMLVVAYAFAQEQEQKTDGWVIQGFLDGNYKADKVYLVEEEYINGPSKIIDSAKVVDNRYEFKGPRVDVPKMYFIKSADPNCLSPITPVFIENGVNDDILKEIALETKRIGNIEKVFKILKDNDVEVYVLSGGIKNIINHILIVS